jgi:hypothetical protein
LIALSGRRLSILVVAIPDDIDVDQLIRGSTLRLPIGDRVLLCARTLIDDEGVTRPPPDSIHTKFVRPNFAWALVGSERFVVDAVSRYISDIL